MGMAASQARLLSITSRLGDNELRAQIVNNNKMRLAAASSKASAAYVQALNDATMMISNYDAQGNSMYTPLTFNSLTRYSQYNNQYGLTDVNGNLLVSESEANMFRNAHGVLDEYLAAHGFEKATTYFDSTALFDFVQGSENQEIWIDETHTTSLPLEQLKTMYLGGEYTYIDNNGVEQTKLYDSYDVAISNGKYGQYKEQQIAFAESIKKLEQKAKIQSAVNGVLSNNSTTTRNEEADTTQKLFDNATKEDLDSDIQALRNVLGSSQFNSNTVLKTTKNEDGTTTNYTVENLRNDLYKLQPSANCKNGIENAVKVTNFKIYGPSSNNSTDNIYLFRNTENKAFTVANSSTTPEIGDKTIVCAIDNNGKNNYDAAETYNKNLLVYEDGNKYYLYELISETTSGNGDSRFENNNQRYIEKATNENGDTVYKTYEKSSYYINKSNTNNNTTYNDDTILLLSTDSVETLSGDGTVVSNPSTIAGEATTINTKFDKGGYFYTDNNNKMHYYENDTKLNNAGIQNNTDTNGNITYTYNGNDVTDRIYQLSENYSATNIPEDDFKKIREYSGDTRILYELASDFATKREGFDGNTENITPYFAPVNTGWATRASIATNNNANSVRCVTYARNVDSEGNVTYSPNYFYGEDQGYNDYQYKPDTYTFGNGSSSVAIDFSNLDTTKTLFYDKNGGFIAAEASDGKLYNKDGNGLISDYPCTIDGVTYQNAGEYLTANNVLFSVNKYGNSLMFRTMDDRKVSYNGNYYYMPMGIGGDLREDADPSVYCGFPANNTNDEGLSVDYKTRYRFIDGLRYYLHIDYTNIKNGDEDQLFYGNHQVTNLEYEESGENEGRLKSFKIDGSKYELQDDGTYKNNNNQVVDPARFITKVDTNNISISFVNDKSVKSDEEIYDEVIEKCKEYLNLVNNNVYMVDYYSNGGDSTDSANDSTDSANDEDAQNLAHNNYKRAADTLIQTLFGEVSPNTTLGRYIYANLGNFTNGAWLFSEDNFVTDTQDTLKSYMQGTIEIDTFQQLSALDQLFEKYGAPNCTWIDKNDPNGNADNKVQWYINLFNRMCEGYKALEDGLASSNEWIEFALESGLVTMEQVDLNHSWNPTMYSNVSDITEVTDNAAVAKAEAEYNKAMKNIEAKDKRLDIELKNIDTEHNALQTEYEQIKNVISKNIERSFKIYS